MVDIVSILLSVVLAVVLLCIVAGIGKCISVVASVVRIKHAVRNMPIPRKQHWLLGHIPYGIDKDGNTMCDLANLVMPFVVKGHKIFCTNAGPGLYVIHVCHPDTIKHVVGSDPKPELTLAAVKPWLGEGLLTSNGAKWSRHRRLLTNAFHYDILKSYVQIFTKCASVFVNQVDKSVCSDSSVVDIVPLIRLFTLDTLLRCICGKETNCQITGTHVPYVDSVYSLCALSTNRVFSIINRIPWVYELLPVNKEYTKHCDLVHAFAKKIIEERRKEIVFNKEKASSRVEAKKYLDFIDVLLQTKDENGQGLSDLEIREQVDTFMFEGHDTTANSLCWTLYLLAKHPEHQAKCREEVDELFSRKEEIEWDDLKDLTYLHYCIKETNRLYPPAPVVVRELATSRTIEGYQLPKGIPVALQIYGCHHNPHVWNEPEVFDPLRFNPENSKNRDPLAYIPFSAGPRNCIGQNFALAEEKVLLAIFLRTFECSLDEGHTTKPIRRLLLHPDCVYLNLQRRR